MENGKYHIFIIRKSNQFYFIIRAVVIGSNANSIGGMIQLKSGYSIQSFLENVKITLNFICPSNASNTINNLITTYVAETSCYFFHTYATGLSVTGYTNTYRVEIMVIFIFKNILIA